MLGWRSMSGVLLQLAALLVCAFLLGVRWPLINGAEGSTIIKCKQSERAVLLDLKAAAEDVRPCSKSLMVPTAVLRAKRKKISAWLKWDEEDKECCNWQGIVCDAASGSITQLRLPTYFHDDFDGYSYYGGDYPPKSVQCSFSRFLCGALPSSLSRLESLEVLDVRGGCFSDALPSHTFSSLVNLSYLDLSGNPLISSLPDMLLLPPGLTYLNLSNYDDYQLRQNALNLSKLVSSLPNLEYLDLRQSSLQGIIPEEIGSLHHLKYLDLSRNYYLQGLIPQQIGSLQNLFYLELGGSNGRFQNPVPWPRSLANLSHLSHLGLDNVEWPEAHDDWQCNWKALESLSAYRIRFVSNKSLPFCLHDPALVTRLKHLQFENLRSSIAPLLHSLSHANASLSLRTLSLPSNSLWEFETETSKAGAWLRALHTPFLKVLDLSLNALTGLPFWLPHLPLLHSLDMSTNSLPTFPPQLENLQALRSLKFSDNEITGTIPFSLLKPSLLYLDVSVNRLSSFSLGNLSSLSHLDLSYNSGLTGEIPHSIGNLSSLSYLDLHNNIGLTGEIPHSIGKLSSLVSLELSFCSLEGSIPPSIGNLSILIILDLSGNRLISGSIPPSIGNLLSLKAMWLSGNSLTGTIPAGIFQDSLQSLAVSENQLVGSLPKVQNCLSLTEVVLSRNKFSGSLLTFGSAFQHCPLFTNLEVSSISLSSSLSLNFCNNLRVLDISKNQIWGEIPREVGNNCSNLDVLNLSDNFLYGALPAEIGNISSLQILAVSNNALRSHIPASLGNLRDLGILALHHNNLNGILPIALQNCSALQLLDLSYNQLNGSIPQWISGQRFPQMVVLMLSSNQFQGSTLASLVQNFPMLQILGLASNLLMGSIPTNLKLLRAMIGIYPTATTHDSVSFSVPIPMKGLQELLSYTALSEYIFCALDFSDNLLEGEIPPEIGALQWLHSLNLSRNLLNGGIPSSLGNLAVVLASLDLSHNKLIGSIPPELCQFDYLAFLDLSHNRLHGAITASSSCIKLCTFDASSYAGNAKLVYECGANPRANDQETHTLPEADDPPNVHQSVMTKLQESISLAGWAMGHVTGFFVMALFLYRRARIR